MIVLKETPLESGACPIPMHGPQPHSRILAPEAIISAKAPHLESIARIEEPGAITSDTWVATLLPFKIFAAFNISGSDEFVQEPITTWLIFIPFNSLTGTTASGLCGLAVNGTNFDKSTVISSSYVASSSAFNST